MEEQGLKIDKNVIELVGIAEDTLPGKQFNRFVSPVVGEIYRQAKLKDIELDKANKKNEALTAELEVLKMQLVSKTKM